MSRIAAFICSTERGLMYFVLGPPASVKHPPCDVITGVLENKASNIGMPNPSKIEG